jgi:hypothetical protein
LIIAKYFQPSPKFVGTTRCLPLLRIVDLLASIKPGNT